MPEDSVSAANAEGFRRNGGGGVNLTAGAVSPQLSTFMPLILGIGHVRNFIFTPRLTYTLALFILYQFLSFGYGLLS